MISLSDIKVSFDNGKTYLFDQFSLQFETGTVTAVMGLSGTGKTTLLNCIAGLTDVYGCISGSSYPGYVFQEPRLLPWCSALENVALPLRPFLGRSAADACAHRYLVRTGMDSFATVKAGVLSGGEQQRVSLSRGIAWAAVRNSALLLDEPFQGLDVELRQTMMELVKTLLKGSEMLTAVLVTHDVHEALFLADRIVVLGGTPVSVRYDRNIALDCGTDADSSTYLSREILDVLNKLQQERFLRLLSCR